MTWYVRIIRRSDGLVVDAKHRLGFAACSVGRHVELLNELNPNFRYELVDTDERRQTTFDLEES